MPRSYEELGAPQAGGAGPERVSGAEMTASLFPLLGSAPLLDRGFTDADSEPGRQVAVIGHALWQRLFAGNPEIVGRPIIVDGAAVAVVGVMPAGFHFPDESIEIWRPITFDAELLSENNRGSREAAR